MPLRPIVSSIGAVTYQSAKGLSKILKPLVGKSPHHVHNNEEFLQHLKGIQLGPDEVIISYDVKGLFTSVPIQPALTIIEKLLEEDPGLQEGTSMTVKNIICLLVILPREYILHFPEQILWAGWRSCQGLSHQLASPQQILCGMSGWQQLSTGYHMALG